MVEPPASMDCELLLVVAQLALNRWEIQYLRVIINT